MWSSKAIGSMEASIKSNNESCIAARIQQWKARAVETVLCSASGGLTGSCELHATFLGVCCEFSVNYWHDEVECRASCCSEISYLLAIYACGVGHFKSLILLFTSFRWMCMRFGMSLGYMYSASPPRRKPCLTSRIRSNKLAVLASG